MTEMLRLDADVRNADWVKTRTWDLPTTLEELLVTIGGKSGIPRLLASPAAEAMPPALRAQVTATTMTLPALKAYRADLQRLLDGFLQVDEKLRHVRDAEFWGAPVGTPLPLAPTRGAFAEPLTDIYGTDLDRMRSHLKPSTGNESNAEKVKRAEQAAADPAWWLEFDTCRAIRSSAYSLVDRAPSAADPRFERAESDTDAEALASALLEGLQAVEPHDGKLYRSVYVPQHRLGGLKPGDTLDVPLVSAGDDRGVLESIFGNPRAMVNDQDYETVTFVFANPRAIKGVEWHRSPMPDPDRVRRQHDRDPFWAPADATGRIHINPALESVTREMVARVSYTEYIVGGQFVVDRIAEQRDPGRRPTKVVFLQPGDPLPIQRKSIQPGEWDDWFDFPLNPNLVVGLELKLRHVRDADYWGAPVGTPLPLPDGMKIRVPQPVCDELTSLDALPDVLQEFVNNSGTPDNPAHRREFKKAGKTIDVSVNDVVAHINETLDGVDEGTWQEGEQWYQKAHDECVVPWAKEFDVPEEVVAGVIAAISPRMPWDKNVEVAHELIRLWREEDDFGGLPDMDAAKIRRPNKAGEMKMLGLSDNVVQAIRCLRTGDVDKSVSGTKRRSFANNLYDPTAGYDVCNDGWMASMVNRMYPDAGFTAAECDPWLGHTKTISKQEQPGPGGYVIIAEAVRKIAEKRGLLPCQVQAIYWIAVGGGTNKPMYPNAKKEKKAARVVRSSWPFTDVANDPTGGDLTDPDYFDAEALRQGITTEINSAWWLIDGRYEYPSQNPRAAVLANADELKALLDGFLAVKARHVRDAAFWGAPVGTPLPLPKAPDAPRARRVVNADEMRDEYMRIATEKVTPNAEAIDRDDELAPRLKQYVAESISEAMADVPADDMFKATYDERRYTGTEHMGHDAYMEWDRYRSSADVFLHPSQGDPEHTRIAWFEGRLWEYDDRTPPIAVRDPRGPVYANGPVGSPEAEKAKRMFAVSELVHLWAVTSNDSNIPALAMQEVARDVFGLDDAEHWKVDPEEATKVAQTKDTYRSIYERYLRAEYDSTQTLLKGMGITHVRLHRGYTTNGRHSGRVDPPRNNTTVSTRPMSAWSLREGTARNFSLGNGSEVVVTAEFPIERILSTPLTGSGCWGEFEMIVLGGVDETEPFDLTDGEVRVQVKADGPPLSLDDGDLNADWVRTLRWDLPTDPAYYTPEYLMALADLPVGRAMPEELRALIPESKVRHVRDADFWGAPVGTALPLPPMRSAVNAEVPFEPMDGFAFHKAQKRYAFQRKTEIGQTREQIVASLNEHGEGSVNKALVAHDIAEKMSDIPVRDIDAALGDDWSSINSFTIDQALGVDPTRYENPDTTDWVYLNHGSGVDAVHSLQVVGGYPAPAGITDVLGRPPVRVGTPEAEQYVREAQASFMVNQWAKTSNDSHVLSHNIQNAARRVFGLDDAAEWEPPDPSERNRFVEISADIEDMDERYGPIYERFVQAQYDLTQEMLRQQDVDAVLVFRGQSMDTEKADRLTRDSEVVTRPLSSWSTDRLTADGFADMWRPRTTAVSKVTMSRIVEAEDIIATPVTGVGCWGEEEVVLKGGRGMASRVDKGAKAERVRPREPINLDDSELNADWIKTRRWDLPVDPEFYQGTDILQRLADLPAGAAMPEQLRATLGQGGTP